MLTQCKGYQPIVLQAALNVVTSDVKSAGHRLVSAYHMAGVAFSSMLTNTVNDMVYIPAVVKRGRKIPACQKTGGE